MIAIHNKVLGPAQGGTRMWPYQSEAEALNEVLCLSQQRADGVAAGLDNFNRVHASQVASISWIEKR